MTGHTCHAHSCETLVPPRMFMCRRHWCRVSKEMRDAIWRELLDLVAGQGVL